MRYLADLHLHTRYSRATSRDCDLERLTLWARKKGLTVVGTGDITHPGWRAEVAGKLVPAEPGLWQLRPDLEEALRSRVPPTCQGPVRFLLSGEISTIYKRGERTRKVHHLVCLPDLDCCERLVEALERVGNLASDGRPILGLDSRHLLELVLESGPGAFLVPAHIWTPWFAVLGSRSGFDSIEECYGDLASSIFAVETGLSSDPPMNWRVSSLDRYRLISCSDAHSPSRLGREATVLDTPLDFFALRRALETGTGYLGTVEFFPEEGKYHLDGHRTCAVRLSPGETRRQGGSCPACGKPVTVGVMHRVEMLADREEPVRPATGGEVWSLVPLPEILGELEGVGPRSRRVTDRYERILARLGPELSVLGEVPLESLRAAGLPLLDEAIGRLRGGRVLREAGYDGEYGKVRLFGDGELADLRGGQLFAGLALPESHGAPEASGSSPPPGEESPVQHAAVDRPQEQRELWPPADRVLEELDPRQREAALTLQGPLLIVAGPGSGKTRTLTVRIAHLVQVGVARPEEIVALAFTRRAAGEIRERLVRLLGSRAHGVQVHTFHSLALSLLRQHAEQAGLPAAFRVADEPTRLALLGRAAGVTSRRAAQLLEALTVARRTGQIPGPLAEPLARYRTALIEHQLVDLDELVARAATMLREHPSVLEACRQRYRWICVDEYQDVDAQQYDLVTLLAPPGGNLCAIGDPDQAIYSFRGAEVRFFRSFVDDHPGARVVRLARNYRSGAHIVEAAGQVVQSRQVREAVAPEAVPQRIVSHVAPTGRAEAEYVVQELEALLGGHSFFSLDSRRGGGQAANLGFSDMAVLYRTRAQAVPLREALERSGMPFQEHSHELLTASPVVAALVAQLRQPGGQQGGRREDPGEGLSRAAVALAGKHDPAALDPALRALQPLARAYAGDLEGFLVEVALASGTDAWDPRAERISLLTLHGAKGLEFRVVFILGCEDGLLPLSFGEGRPAAAVEEERRLLYVGMTRARERLYLCRARRRRWRGRMREMAPSPFLASIEASLVRRDAGRGRPGSPRAWQRGLFE